MDCGGLVLGDLWDKAPVMLGLYVMLEESVSDGSPSCVSSGIVSIGFDSNTRTIAVCGVVCEEDGTTRVTVGGVLGGLGSM